MSIYNCKLVRANYDSKCYIHEKKSETVSHSSNDDDILISWDVKYISEDERERKQK